MTQPVPPPADLVQVSVNGDRRSFPAGTALDTLVAALTSAPSGVAAAVNEAVVPRGRWSSTALADGDRVEVLTAVQGG
ncbi:sulfur carrier protein ThiS [Streptomyces sp. bgisy091]|uniref:sulfur carrier protein ThiS n=1 Tax=Streptomyces sp. bgisy091 TaxID=3413778 RepID=UPI003D761819